MGFNPTFIIILYKMTILMPTKIYCFELTINKLVMGQMAIQIPYHYHYSTWIHST